MQILTMDSKPLYQRAVVTIGKFDGFHKGHRALFSAALSEKSEEEIFCILSFGDKRESEIGQIYTRKEQETVAKACMADAFAEYELTKEFCLLSPVDFVDKILCDRLNASQVVVGEDFRFGNNREGDAGLLKKLCTERKIRLHIVPALCEDGEKISSTRIRKLLETGNVKEAGRLLAAPYFISGTVMHGKHLGTTIGFPTLNLLPEPEKILPAFGVYAGVVCIENKEYAAVTNIGIRPTVDDNGNITVETHLIGFTGDLYGREIRVSLLDFIRKETKFTSLEKLKERISEDCKVAYEKEKKMVFGFKGKML